MHLKHPRIKKKKKNRRRKPPLGRCPCTIIQRARGVVGGEVGVFSFTAPFFFSSASPSFGPARRLSVSRDGLVSRQPRKLGSIGQLRGVVVVLVIPFRRRRRVVQQRRRWRQGLYVSAGCTTTLRPASRVRRRLLPGQRQLLPPPLPFYFPPFDAYPFAAMVTLASLPRFSYSLFSFLLLLRLRAGFDFHPSSASSEGVRVEVTYEGIMLDGARDEIGLVYIWDLFLATMEEKEEESWALTGLCSVFVWVLWK